MSNFEQLLNDEPFSLKIEKSGIFGMMTYSILYEKKHHANVNPVSYAKSIVNLFNTAHKTGLLAGKHHVENYTISVDTEELPKPYTLEIYSELDDLFDFSIAFNKVPLENYKGISLTALKHGVAALNNIYNFNFKRAVELLDTPAVSNDIR